MDCNAKISLVLSMLFNLFGLLWNKLSKDKIYHFLHKLEYIRVAPDTEMAGYTAAGNPAIFLSSVFNLNPFFKPDIRQTNPDIRLDIKKAGYPGGWVSGAILEYNDEYGSLSHA